MGGGGERGLKTTVEGRARLFCKLIFVISENEKISHALHTVDSSVTELLGGPGWCGSYSNWGMSLVNELK